MCVTGLFASAVGYHTGKADHDGETRLEGQLSLSFVANTSMVLTNEDAAQMGSFINEEIDNLVGALMLEKDRDICPV